MLILDKQKAVARVVALTSGLPEPVADPPAIAPHARTYQRIATYERRAHPAAAPPRRAVERRRKRPGPVAEPSLT